MQATPLVRCTARCAWRPRTPEFCRLHATFCCFAKHAEHLSLVRMSTELLWVARIAAMGPDIQGIAAEAKPAETVRLQLHSQPL